MMNYKRVTFSVVLSLVLLWAGSYPLQAQEPTRIPSVLMQKTEQGSTAEFFVILREQADLQEATYRRGKAKAHYVYQQLWQTAQQSQRSLTTQLKKQNIPYHSFYIINALLVEGDRKVLTSLAAHPDVMAVEANTQLRGLRLPNDAVPSISQRPQTGGMIEPNLIYVNADDVWAMGYRGQGIVIGGQDTGYDWTHPALAGKYRGGSGSLVNHDYNWHDSIHTTAFNSSCGTDSPEPCDDHLHGTHTMGIAVGDDGLGNQIGMAPEAQWIGCRNMDEGHGTPATYLECFEFFLAPYPLGGTPAQGNPELAPDVTINSWSCPQLEGCTWQTLQAAVNAQRAAGIMTVGSAGNEGLSGCRSVINPPGIYDAVYSVGALNQSFTGLASFSSRGPVTIDGSNRLKPDITAPGTQIRSSMLNNSYGSISGTSMAAPHVAGAVALLWSAVPALKNEVVLTEIYLNGQATHIDDDTCDSPGTSWPNMAYGYGHLDIERSIQHALQNPPSWLYLPLILSDSSLD
ncbi:MAG: S8 family serine peptidase [Chloroflexota bacterium]